ncbi:unnamed protein product [Protopolystoma xenopodis]|uniref:Uncharacterized protein n=1 Tax=Protopolystoma xenopodis TaxID=117903 RepID=A0A3S5CNW8_9PLAT|nr:unnamed protein product [Protopolystoma xenopodis]
MSGNAYLLVTSIQAPGVWPLPGDVLSAQSPVPATPASGGCEDGQRIHPPLYYQLTGPDDSELPPSGSRLERHPLGWLESAADGSELSKH